LPDPATLCHCCQERPAEREARTHMVPFQRMCQPCLDAEHPEGSAIRVLFYEPNGGPVTPEPPAENPPP